MWWPRRRTFASQAPNLRRASESPVTDRGRSPYQIATSKTATCCGRDGARGLVAPPGERGARSVIEYHPHDGSRAAGEPPTGLSAVDPVCEADIGDRADAADGIEREETFQRRKPLQSLIAIGELV